jgi:type IV pilus assembly protein PilY1
MVEVVMQRTIIAVITFAIALIVASTVLAAPDQYPGDAAIYGSVGTYQPNVLIIIDNSGSMSESVPVTSYNPATTYTQSNKCYNGCSANAVYSQNEGYTQLNSSISNITTSCNSVNPQSILQTTGQYSGRTLGSNGTTCTSSGTSQYFTGNYINYLYTVTKSPKIDIAKSAIKNLISTTTGVKFGLMTFHYTGSFAVASAQGAQFLSTTVSSAQYVTTVKKMNDIFTGTTTNRTALLAAVDTLVPTGYTPLGESLFEAMRYFNGEATAFGNTIGIVSGKYVSPVEVACQKNYVIFVTDGMATADDDPVLKTICSNGDCDGDGIEPGNLEHSLDDVAKALNLSPQQVVTYTIGFGLTGADATAIDLLNRAADASHGKGKYYDAGSAQDLQNAFSQVMGTVTAIDTTFGTGSVPASPENRTYAGSRLYMPFFKTANSAFWNGNLKKYGLSSGNNPNITDINDVQATYVDQNNDGIDDITLSALPAGVESGAVKSSATSYWSTSADGSTADKGGAGAVLQAKVANTRTLYTVLPTGNSKVTFDLSNMTAPMLGVANDAERDKVINFMYGQDVDDADKNGNTTENRSWLMGDPLHAKPLAVSYASYSFSTTNEANCSVNKSVLYMSSNDGVLHAFRDCDGAELWGFIPPDILGSLSSLRTSGSHVTLLDAVPRAYIYDANNNGTIESGDKVILLFGGRRGGGVASGTAAGSYYALDVSDPASPQFLWRISNSSPTSGGTAVYPELAESWSEPKIVKMRIANKDKIAMVIGAGYDNLNEDGRYGATQTFAGTGVVPVAANAEGAVTSSGTAAPANPKGRGVYVVEIATLNGGVPNFNGGGSKIGGFTYDSATAPYSAMTFSFPSEIAAVDLTGNGYAERLYAADAGGNIWRFDVADLSPTNWTARKLFSANPGAGGASDKGRKMFYKPSVVSELGYKMLYFGSGDREHPLNTAVVDRIYALIDRDQTTTLAESNLMDVTTDQLQTTTTASGTGSITDLLSKLNAATNYGWYIKLDQNSGEKVLSAPLVFNKVAYFTTYAPGSAVVVEACQPNLGTARMYALSYKTGEAAVNYDTSNDSTATTNQRAKSGGGILVRSDRVKTTGSGIPPGVTALITPGGGVSLWTGMQKQGTLSGGSIIPLYWRQK